MKKNGNYLFLKELDGNRRIGVIYAALVTVLVSVAFWLSHRTFNGSAEKYFEQQAYDTMTEVSFQISKDVSNKIQYWFEQLELAGGMVTSITTDSQDIPDKPDGQDSTSSQDIPDKPDGQDSTSSQDIPDKPDGQDSTDSSDADRDDRVVEDLKMMNNTAFECMGILTEDGVFYFTDGTSCEASEEPYVLQILQEDDGKMAGSISVEGFSDKLIFAVPLLEGNGEFPAAVVGVVESEAVRELLETQVFGENMAYVVISNEKGNLIIQTDAKKQFGDNLLDTFTTFAEQEAVDTLRAELAAGNSGTLDIMGVTTQFLMYYTPVWIGEEDGAKEQEADACTIDNWRLMILTSRDILTANMSSLFKESKILLYSILSVLSVLLFALVYILVKKRNNELILRCVDPMTGLLHDDRFERDAAVLTGKSKASYAVVSYNIVRFKLLNNKIGREKADEILGIVGAAILDFIRRDEAAAHSFADRFTVLMRMDTEDGEDRIRLLEKRLQASAYPQQTHPKFTIGVYRMEPGNVDIGAAMDRVRVAQTLTREKGASLSNMVVYSREMLEKQKEEGQLADMAESALENHHFLVYYQLKRNIQNNGWAGCEALVRWKDPKLGFLYPGKFIPVFEKNGFIVKLDKYVFETMCRDLHEMLEKGEKPVPVSINLSQRHFEEQDFLDDYERILDFWQVPHDLVEFEVTETLVAKEPEQIKKMIARLHSIGCRCSIDDFGIGYSSLHMIQEFQFDTIKLDRSFFYGSDGFNSKSQMIVETLIALSHKLGKTVVSEGIENEEQVKFLREKQCDMIQGCYYAKPAPAKECRKMLD